MSKVIILENTFYTVLSLRIELMNYLKEKGHDLTVISTGNILDIQKLEMLGYQCIDTGSVVLNPLKAIRYCLHLMRNVRSVNPDFILSFTIRPNIFGSLVARYLSIPIIANVTGTGPLTDSDSLVYKLIRILYRFAFQKNKTVFFQNEDDLHFFIQHKYVRNTQAKLLPGSGVDTDYYAPRIKIEHDFSFLMISRLIRDKGVVEYLEASKILKKKYNNIRFKLLGPFWEQSMKSNTITKDEIQNYVNDGVIEYLGYTLDVRDFIAESNCVVLPSYREGCANVLMQSASMSLPLIATDVTGCKNLIEDAKTGFLCKVKNVEDLARMMERLYNLSEEERVSMGNAGRKKMISEYQKVNVLRAYEEEMV